MNDAPLPDPLEDFLQSPPTPDEPAGLRAALRRQTTRHVRRRRLARRLTVAGSLAAAVLLAALVGWLAWPTPTPEAPPPERPLAVRPEPPPAPPPPAAEPELPPAVAKEWQAFDAPPSAEKVTLLREAGDLYLEEQRDFASAVRCYRQALDAADGDALAIDPNDNWLVMALKLDRQMEE